ncbi:MAG: DUF1573 domain-containing protein [candidate division KSB1 bacterium]|nr:DUF1573 domain-containing protein [candidate division KSB1 bacterium]MDZ7364762.1 DUF1573 domain-containing protein [candidate division KSB1 bacterium]MDZ7402490.1 DUF1573 domain-containing protein [candidate division KSB1 bacterium]
MSRKRIFSLALVSVIVLSCNFAHAQGGANGAKGPKIQFKETSYDFGTAAQNTQVKHVFKFKNVGTDTLTITQVKTSCGCTAAESSKIIAPQKDGQIEVTYNTGTNIGKVSKTVYVFSNDVESPQRSISIYGVVEAKKSEE